MKNNRNRIVNIVVFVLLFFFAGIVLFQANRNSNQASMSISPQINFVGEYSQNGGAWTTISDDTDICAFDGDLILRGRFSEELPEGVQIIFYLNHIRMDIYMDGELIYESSYEMYPDMCGDAWTTWILPEMGEEDEIEIHLHNPHKYGNHNAYNQYLDSIYLGSDVVLQEQYNKQTMPYKLFCAFVIVVSIAIIGTAIGYELLRLPNSTVLYKLGITSLLMGVYMYFDVKYFLFPSSKLVLNTYIRQMAIMLGACMFGAVITEVLEEKRKKIASIAVGLLVATDVVFLAMVFGGKIRIYDTGMYWAIIQGIISLILIVLCVKEIKNSDKHNMFMFFSIVALLSVLVAELINARLSWWNNGNCIKVVFSVLLVIHLVYSIKLMAVNYQESIRARALEKELRENQITLAMSQIKPHFIYNSLNSIYHLCDKDVAVAQKAISDFSDYLRRSIGAVERTTLVPFEEELNHVKTYLSLEQMRFGDDLRVEYNIGTTEFMIPTLSVQPLVENAVKHGICQREEGGGTITITVREEQNCFEIFVCDDGVGFNPDEEYQGEGTHVGIKNVRQRLEVMCNATLDVTSEPGKGTTVIIRIRKENGE